MEKIGIILFFIFLAGNANAEVPLEGNYLISGSLDYNGSTKPGKSHIYFTVTSDAAKKLFNAFEGKPTMSACTGWNYKSQGNITCHETELGKSYFCTFSVNLIKNTVGTGLGGCF